MPMLDDRVRDAAAAAVVVAAVVVLCALREASRVGAGLADPGIPVTSTGRSGPRRRDG